ncbi:MAG: hypothetical protein F9Y92_00625 [Thermoplasmatales archaeon]|jgi:KaiC/GvpD/RAD55 family RecA-like ATPase|nr:hypothetical protein [Thermoplasmatales archaeon]
MLSIVIFYIKIKYYKEHYTITMNGLDINYRFPYELIQFLLAKNGNSLLVKGPPGGGKTTISLQILETLQGKSNIIYLSTRVGDASLYQQFPWLKDMEKNLRLLVASKLLLEAMWQLKEEEESQVKEYGRRVLQEMTGEAPKVVPRIEFNKVFQGKAAPEVNRIYDEVQMNLPSKSIIVIDSVEGITSRFGIREDIFVSMIQKDLVEGANASVIFVSEKSEQSSEDYIVDGVIYLYHDIDDGRRKRILRINKLRGVEINQSSYSYTLLGGKFFTFYPGEFEKVQVTKFEYTMNEGIFSTGIRDLDRLLGNGLNPSSFLTVELGKDISMDELRLLFRPIFLNFLYNGIGIFMVPLGGWNAIRLEKDLTRFIDAESFRKRVRYIDYTAEETNIPFVVAAGSRDEQQVNQRLLKALLDLTSMENRSVLHFIGTDTMEYIKGTETSIKELFNMAQLIKSSSDVAILTVRESQSLKNEIINISDYYIKLVEIENVPFIYGIKPRIVYHAIQVDRNRGFPNVTLVPML